MKSIYCPFCKSQSFSKSRRFLKPSKEMTCLKCHRSFPTPRGRKRLKAWLLVSGVFVCVSPLLLNSSMKGLSQLLPDRNTKAATAIVVLGRGPDNRLERSLAAAQLFYEHRTDVFVSGMSDAPIILNYLAEMGVPEKHLAGERCSQSTWENALFLDAIMREQDKETVILVTDESHLLRAYLVFKGFGLDITPYRVSQEQGSLVSPKQAWGNLREYIALIAYAGNQKLWPKDENERKINAYQAKQKIADWGCSL